MSKHMTKLIRKLTDAELVSKIEAFAYTTDAQMRGWLIAEAKRRGL